MRDIKFRGKRLDNEEWVYGSLLLIENLAYIYDGDSCPSEVNFEYEFIAVDPATVGQYTGLRDRAGEMIWEGDILSDGAFTYEVRYKGTGFVTILYGHVYTMDTRPTKIVIGNIHDNPDLLK